MRISITAMAAEVKSVLRGFESQVPFAAARAINQTALDAQDAQRKHQHVVFTFRRPASQNFGDKAVKLKPFATKARLEAVIAMDGPAGASKDDLFTKFERGGKKRSRKPGGRLAIPNIREARTSRSDNSRRNKRPKDFNFTEVVPRGGGFKGHVARQANRNGRVRVFRGKGRTFMIQNPDGTGGIFLRMGRRSGGKRKKGGRARLASNLSTRKVFDTNIQTLYRFTKEAPIDNRLQFETTITGSVRAVFKRHFEVQLGEAIKTSKERSAAHRARRRAAQ
jgi:hypothetical protein